MNKLIIIGNGFDLAHGLKTRYSDFLTWYINYVFKQHYLNRVYDDNLVCIEGSVGFKVNFANINEFYSFYKSHNKGPIKFKSDYFRSLVFSFSKPNWVDIETDYYTRLLKFYKQNEQNESKYWDSVVESVANFHLTFEAVKDKLIEYLDTIQITGDHFNGQINETLHNIYYENDPSNENSDNVLGDMFGILNFNYTSTLDMYTSDFETYHRYMKLNIHGSIKENSNPIIFGYGDEMDPHYPNIENLNNNEFLKNIKSFGYFKTNNYRRFISFIEDSDFKVYILGHSCGLSDRILLNSIFENKNCRAIKIYYHQRSETDTDFFEKTQEISRHFRPENKGLMRKLIVPFPECMPLT